MKVIGTAGREQLIIYISETELCNLLGFYNSYSTGFEKKLLEVGSTIDIGAIYKDAREFLDTHANAIDAAKKLRLASDKFLTFFPQVEPKSK
jgi:hypothetical protein